MKPHRGIAMMSVLLCASCQVQQYIDNEDLRIYNTPIGKTRPIAPCDAPNAPEPQAYAPPAPPAAPATPAPLPPSIHSGSDWTEENPGSI